MCSRHIHCLFETSRGLKSIYQLQRLRALVTRGRNPTALSIRCKNPNCNLQKLQRVRNWAGKMVISGGKICCHVTYESTALVACSVACTCCRSPKAKRRLADHNSFCIPFLISHHNSFHHSLHSFCDRWGLTVNSKKTVCMILQRGNNIHVSKTISFTYNNKKLDVCNSVKYLGIDISCNGSYTRAIHNRIAKTQRAANMCKQAFATTGNVNVKLALTIFDRQIIPVLTYGCAIWGCP